MKKPKKTSKNHGFIWSSFVFFGFVQAQSVLTGGFPCEGDLIILPVVIPLVFPGEGCATGLAAHVAASA